MRQARVKVNGVEAGVLQELERGRNYVFRFLEGYSGDPVLLTMPVENREMHFDRFPSFFDGVLPEGEMLEGLLRISKIDKDDYFSQLVVVGGDLVGAVTVEEIR